MRIGFLPYLSEREPQSGLKRNCINENIPAMRPIIDSLICSSFIEKEGSKGIIIPNPSKSMKIVRKIIKRVDLFCKIQDVMLHKPVRDRMKQ